MFQLNSRLFILLGFVLGLTINVCGSNAKQSRVVHCVLVEEAGFPVVETDLLTFSDLQNALKNNPGKLELSKAGFADLHRSILEKAQIDLLIWPYGSAMTDKAWKDILPYLQHGGNLMVTGGRPFSMDVDETANGYRLGTVTNRFTEQLSIFEAYPIPVESLREIVRNPEYDFLSNISGLKPQKAYSLLTFSGTNKLPEGLWGNLSSRFTSLVTATDSTNVSTIPLVSCMDRYHSDFVGGRWVFFTFTPQVGYWRTAGGENMLKSFISYAAQKPVEIDIVPDYAFYKPGEKAGLEVRLHFYQPLPENSQMDVKVTNEGKMVESFTNIKVAATDTLVHLTLKNPVQEGLHQIAFTLKSDGRILEQREGGFIAGDIQKLHSGLPFSTNSHFLKRGENVYPVVGMTYMATEKNRYFLKYPNPVAWDRDMKQMKALGINMLRTGLWKWYPHEQFMDGQGQPNEKILRSLDAWLYTAKKYDLPVQYCLFPFQPQVEGSMAPFTDREALDVQYKYLQILAQRYKNNPDLMWDLMNEPTYGKAGYLWSGNIPTGTESEKTLWNEWLQKKYGKELNLLPGKLNITASDLFVNEKVKLPENSDLAQSNIYGEGQKPLMAYDYNLFAQFAYNQWAGKARNLFRDAGSNQLMVTGMDEGGVSNRILASFYAETSDFTVQHSWWLDDDLLWDNLMAKTLQKPLLVQETNVMRYTDLREKARRNEQDYRNILERKLCIGLGAEGAGVIPWVWNANTLLNENESSIGIYRGDGTASPELAMYRRFIQFVTKNADYFSAVQQMDILLVAPHSLQFTDLQTLAMTATKNAVRAMHYYAKRSFVAVGEYQLDQVTRLPKLILLPSAQVLSDQAWEKLRNWVAEGAILLVTGPIDRNPHFEPVQRLSGVGLDMRIASVLDLHSTLIVGKECLPLDFYNTKAMQTIDKMIWKKEQGTVKEIPLGKGKMLVTEYPVELNTNLRTVAALYDYAANVADIEPAFRTDCTNPGILIRPVDYEKARLYLIESETNTNESFTITDNLVHQTFSVKLEAGRAKLLLISKQDGSVIDQY